jgi:hypothetical protein
VGTGLERDSTAGAPRTRGIAVECAVVLVALIAAGYAYLLPASTRLLRGDARVMVGDDSDSVTNPWQYHLVLEVFRSHPQDLLFGAVYTNQIGAPEGYAAFIPWVERILVLLFAPFVGADLMPTAMVWALMVLSGGSFYLLGRVLGWPRAVALAAALAWAFCPFTRARATVHIALVGTYAAPLILAALHVLARPPGRMSPRRATIVAAAMILFSAFSAHYYVMVNAILAPLFALFYVWLLPRGTSRLRAAGRLVLATLPAVAFVAWSLLVPVPSYGARAMARVVAARSESAQYLQSYGAHPADYVTGDVKLGERDTIPARAALTRAARAQVADNRHERSNGIRWSVLACFAALGVALAWRRARRRLSADERVVGVFSLVLALSAFLLAMSPSGLRIYDVDLGPIQLVGKVFPRFRVPNRLGIIVHLAALLGSGVLVTRLLRGVLGGRDARALVASVALPLVVLVDYAPLEPMPLAPLRARRTSLEEGRGARGCGFGLAVPYTTWGFHDEDYYRLVSELRGTSCKILHASYLTREDEALRVALGKAQLDASDARLVAALARCAGASWLVFRLDTPDEQRHRVCDELGFVAAGGDSCRAPSAPLPRPRSLRECVDELHLALPPP